MTSLNSILAAAITLIVIWLIASITKFLAGALLNLLLVFGIILLIVWALQRLR